MRSGPVFSKLSLHTHIQLYSHALRPPYYAADILDASIEKRNVTVCLSRRHTHRDSPRGSMRRGQRAFRPDNKDTDMMRK